MEIKGIKYKLPKSWGDISVETYLKLAPVIKEEYASEFRRTIHILSVLTGIPVEVMLKEETSKFIEIQKNFIFLAAPPSVDMIDSFKIDDVEYRIEKNPTRITTEELIDLHELCKDPNVNNIPQLLGLFYREVVDGKRNPNYNGDEVSFRRELFLKKLSIDKVFGCTTFFLTWKRIYFLRTPKYSLHQKIKIAKMKK